MTAKTRKRTCFLQVDERKVLMSELHVDCQQSGSSFQNSICPVEGHEFTSKVFMELQDVILARLLSVPTATQKGIPSNQGTVKGQEFLVEYSFNKRKMKQILLTGPQKLVDIRKLKYGTNNFKSVKDSVECSSDAKDYSGGGYASLTFLPEKLIATVRPLVSSGPDEIEVTSKQRLCEESAKAARGISKYFHAEDQVTESARKRQKKLQSIARRVKDDGSSAVVEPKTSAEPEEATVRPEQRPRRISTTSSAAICGEVSKIKNKKENSSTTSQKRRRRETDSEDEEKQSEKSNKSNAKRSRTRERLGRSHDASRVGKLCEEVENCSDLQDFQESQGTTAPKRRKLFNLQNLAYTRKTKSLKSKTVACKVDEKREHCSTRGTSSEKVVTTETDCVGSEKTCAEEVLTVEDNVEENSEGLHSSPVEPITIEDNAPDFSCVRCIEDLSVEHVEHLVWGMKRDLKNIFEGKTYCRRHEDYKKGGRSKGDLAFQVQFGGYSQDQQEAIMDVLVDIFCYKHSQYLDYITKVLLPETMIAIHLKIVGGSRDEVERALFETTDVPFAYGLSQ